MPVEDMKTYIDSYSVRLRKHVLIAFGFFLLFCWSTNLIEQNYGNFPYEESFLSNIQPGDVTKPASPLASTPNKATFTNNGLQLTPNEQYSFGGIFVNNRSFTSVNGIVIEFEYMVYGGTGGDGLSVFLFDEQTPNPTIGAVGAGIGYAYNRAHFGQFSQLRMKGLAGAYMGVAFDAFGNFKGMRYQGESRVNGIPFSQPVSNSFNDTDNIQNQVTIRGAKGVAWTTIPGLEDGFTGYPVLITQSTMQNLGFILNYDPEQNTYINDGRYRRYNNFGEAPFNINGGGQFEDESNPAYRKAIVELFPVAAANEGGFLVTVKIQHGGITSTIIDDYHYKSATFPYPENAVTDGNTGDNGAADNLPRFQARIRDITATVPEKFKMGLAASTGEKTNFHFIKNLRITLPRAAEAYDDYIEEQKGVTSVTIDPLENDLAYTGIIERYQVGSVEYINKNTFRFRVSDGQPTPNPYLYTEVGVGTWTYNPATGILTFVPLSSFTGEATINYDIKGGLNDTAQELPYSDEAYRSLPATITVNIITAPVTHRQMVTNKMITVKLK